MYGVFLNLIFSRGMASDNISFGNFLTQFYMKVMLHSDGNSYNILRNYIFAEKNSVIFLRLSTSGRGNSAILPNFQS